MSSQSVHISRVCWRSTIEMCFLNLPKHSTPRVKSYFGLSLHIFQHSLSLSLENVCDSWCMVQWKRVVKLGAVVQRKSTKLCSSAAIVPQSKSTEMCSLVAVVPQSKSTELCSSEAVVPHKVTLSSCVVAWRPSCHKVNLVNLPSRVARQLLCHTK